MEPKIRFKGFEGEWKASTIGDFTTSFSGGTPTAGASEFYGGNIPFIRSGEIHESKTELFLTEAGLNNSSAKVVEKGTLLYALYGATSGEVGISKIKGAINQAILAIYPNKTVDKRFLANYLQSHKQKIVGELLQGGQGNLSGALVKSISVTYPNNHEQQAISNYVDSLDSQISASTSRLASLKQMKAASLQAMFPQEGETVPKVRFKGFEGEWKKVKFSDLAERISTTEQSGILPGVEYEDIISGEGRLNKDVYQKEFYKYGIVFNTGDILFGKLRPYLKNILLADFHGVAVGDFWVLRSKENNSNFLYTLVNSNSFMEVANISSGSKMPRADWNLVSATIFAVPSDEEEQKLIGNYFTTLDRQITLQTQRLEKLKQIKSACLDKMFV